MLEENLGPLSEPQRKLASILEVVRVEEFIPRPRRGCNGRPAEDQRLIARAFIAKAVLNLPHTRSLIDRLLCDGNLRRICGWQRRQDVPSESTFSRAFNTFAKSDLPARVHEALIQKHVSDQLVGHISRDSTAIEAREKPAAQVQDNTATPAASPARRRGRPRKGEPPAAPKEPTRLEKQAADLDLPAMLAELPTVCNVGCKKNSQGFVESWRGYKFHIDWGDSTLPISCLLTSASLHDSQAAIPLALISARRVTSLYDLMDAAYDARPIYQVSSGLGHVPIIDQNRRKSEKIPMAPATAVRYRERSTAERGNAQLKDNFGGRFVRVRGHAKVKAHLMFGILALTADTLLRLVL